jgi:hypothetical protein
MQVSAQPVLKSGLALLAVAAAAIAISAAFTAVHAQNQEEDLRPEVTAPTYYAQFQYATLTGTTNTINMTRVPVVTATGTVYKNITLQVTVDSKGDVTLASGSPTVVASPSVVVSAFKAGTYVGPSTVNGGRNLITVSGPAVVPGGTTVWSITASPDADSCTYPASGTWYVGPISGNNPLAARLVKAGITSTAYSYGTGGDSDTSCTANGDWAGGTIIGASQTGNQLVLSSFSSLGFADHNAPIDQITYTLQP